MEKFPQIEQESGVNRVVGFDSKTEEELLNYFKHVFESNSPHLLDAEMTLEQVELIGRINKEMLEFLAQYGVKAIEIPPANVHVIDKTKISQDQLKIIQNKFGTENGFYASLQQRIAIMKDYEGNKLEFLRTLIHEMLHLEGFYSYQKSERGSADLTLDNNDQSVSMNIRRSGFSIGTQDGKQLLFHKLNESVITELQIRFESKYLMDWPEIKDEIEKREKYLREIAAKENRPVEKLREIIAQIESDGASGYKWTSYAYHKERQDFNSLVDMLYHKNVDEFDNREQVFTMFAEATMNGKILPIARLIERTFGKGSFRMIGERSSNKPNS